MNRDFQNTQKQSRSPSTDSVPQSSPAVTVNPNDEALLAQLAAMSNLLQLPVGDSSFHISDPLTESNAQQHHQSSSSHLYEQPIPGPSSQQILSPFPEGSHWPQSYHDFINNLASTSTAGPSHAISDINSLVESPGSSIAAEPELEHAAAEEKRRRNTAASARFRVKKKMKTINLERSVSDLTGRADELEREVADLRRENDWLKEIVMLKGTRVAAFNLSQHLLAMNQNLINEARQNSRSNSLGSEVEEESEDEGDETEAKGKGKSKSKRSL